MERISQIVNIYGQTPLWFRLSLAGIGAAAIAVLAVDSARSTGQPITVRSVETPTPAPARDHLPIRVIWNSGYDIKMYGTAVAESNAIREGMFGPNATLIPTPKIP